MSHGRAGGVVARRKAALKKAQRKNPGRAMEWINGRLYFSETKEAVPGAPPVGVSVVTERRPATGILYR